MRIGFVHGVQGDPLRLQRALASLQGCGAIISLGDWLGESQPTPAFLAPLLEEDPRFRFLAGAHERHWARRGNLPAPVQRLLRRLPSVSLEHGLAVVGRSFSKTGIQQDSLQRLVAPLAIYAHRGESRLWREVGGLVRVEAAPAEAIAWGDGARQRLDLGAGGEGGPGCAVVDLAEGTIQVFGSSEVNPTRGVAPRPRRRRVEAPEQFRLAV